jgi:hypothetical protein
MNKDSVGGLFLLLVLLVSITQRKFTKGLLELLVKLTKPGSTILLLGGCLVLFMKGYNYTALSLGLLSMFLLKDMWVLTSARRLYNDVQRDQSRFVASNSIDLQFAQKSISHDSPSILSSSKSESMLIFPPSNETLQEMCG